MTASRPISTHPAAAIAAAAIRAAAAALALATVALLALCCLAGCSLGNSGSQLTPATVERVVDGDTLIVDLQGERTRVRLLYIDTPESVKSGSAANCSEGEEASAFLKELLPAGTTVYLQQEEGGDDTDTYGRALRFVWLEDVDDLHDKELIKTKMVNALLVAQGWAVVTHYADGTQLGEYLKNLQKQATSPFTSGRTAQEAIDAGKAAEDAAELEELLEAQNNQHNQAA